MRDFVMSLSQFILSDRLTVFRCFLSGLMSFLVLISSLPLTAHAQHSEEYRKTIIQLTDKSRNKIKDAVDTLSDLNEPKALPALQALIDKRLVRVGKDQIYILNENKSQATDVFTGESREASKLDYYTPAINNSVRRLLRVAMGQLMLQSDLAEDRLGAAEELVKRRDENAVDALRIAIEKESVAEVKETMLLALSFIQIDSKEQPIRLEGIESLGKFGNVRAQSVLEPLLAKNADGNFQEPDEAVRQAARKALDLINTRLFFIGLMGDLFRGISLGSVLLLVSLGLAITFGLMRVINMAHGEMIMLGAYCTYAIQNLFQSHLPGAFDFYLLASMPIAFGVTFLVGMLMERTVIRFLYGRPLETLLATWGLSLVLIQTIRLIFGAQNVEVANPSWLSGGMTAATGLVLPYSRISIIAFVIVVVMIVWMLLQKTPLGLQVRAVTQNRRMAQAMGISTARVDMMTFGLGSGIAGLGGVALSQLGNVGPELGQLYIVDTFMVVVLGGVGKIIGTIISAMGIGVVSKFLEPFSGAVFGKIFILVMIILFIQKRPQGLFALKGRDAEG